MKMVMTIKILCILKILLMQLMLLCNASAPIQLPEDLWWSEIPNSHHVQLLTAETFDKELNTVDSALVMFYAPWSGHCKALRPIFANAAFKCKEMNISGIFAAVNGIKEQVLCERFKVHGFTTLLYFENGVLKYDVPYRTMDDIIKFMAKPAMPPPPAEIPWNEMPSRNVQHLDDSNFVPFLNLWENVFLAFHVPNCQACHKMRPDFEKAAQFFKNDSSLKFAAIDCSKYNILCSRHVQDYPTVKYFHFPDIEEIYNGVKEASHFIIYVNSKQNLMQKTNTIPLPPKELWWTGVNHKQYVSLLSADSFDQNVNSAEYALVMFYASWDGFSKVLRFEFAEAASRFINQSEIMFAAIDTYVESSIAEKYSITAYPTVKLFRNGKFILNYLEERTADSIEDFVNHHLVKNEL